MEDLTKQQIVLLTLFVSFVTSIATGIVSVSLMNQAPVGVTQTINRIVERTIEKVTPDTNATAAAAQSVPAPAETTGQVIARVSKSIVRLKSPEGETLAFGTVLSKEGVIVTDKIITASSNVVAEFADGKQFPIQVIQSQILGDIVFVAAITPRDYQLQPVTYFTEASSTQLGTTVLTLGGKNTMSLDEGLLAATRVNSDDPIETTLSSKNSLPGSPLLSLDGKVIGIKTSTLSTSNSFYPLSALLSIAPSISR